MRSLNRRKTFTGRTTTAGAVGTVLAATMALVPMGTVAPAAAATNLVAAASSCNNAKPLANTTVPKSLLPDLPSASQIKLHDSIASWDGPKSSQTPVPYTDVKITPAEAKKICNAHLTAVFLNWSNVTYNKAIIDGIANEFKPLGVKLLRVTDSEFSPTGLAGDISAVLPLNPDIVIEGGTISPSEMVSLNAPVISRHKVFVSWGNIGPGITLGPSGKLQALVGYDWYYLGEQMATAVHQQFPHGANLGYVHWINDDQDINLRESGFLAGLKKYPNIHVITEGGPANPLGTNSGFSQPTATSAESYTESFLQTHKNVNVLFAAWENPPALGEVAAVKALHLQNKVKVVTMDLAEAGAQSLSHHGSIVVDMAEDIYIGGRMMAATAALAAIHAKYPDFVVIPTEAATAHNVTAAWDVMHGPGLPCAKTDCG